MENVTKACFMYIHCLTISHYIKKFNYGNVQPNRKNCKYIAKYLFNFDVPDVDISENPSSSVALGAEKFD